MRQGLEVEINKRISVSVFDRFGRNHFMFLNQFDNTQKSLKKFEAQKLRHNLEDSLVSVEQKVEEKKKELALLSKFNRKKITEAENLWNHVEELKEDIESELDFFNSQNPDPTEDVQETESYGNRQVDQEATILQWRLDSLPKVPTD